MDKLLTVDDWIKKEFYYRLNVLKMPRYKIAESFGYTSKGFRLMCVRLGIKTSHTFVNINGDIIRRRINDEWF